MSEVFLSDFSVFRAKEGKNFTAIIIQKNEEQFNFSVPNNSEMSKIFTNAKDQKKIVVVKVDLLQKRDGNCYFIPLAVTVNSKV